MACAWKRSRQTSPATATPLWSCCASTPTTSPSSTGTSPDRPVTRSPTHRRFWQRHADPHAHRCRPSRRQDLRVRARRRRLPHQALRAAELVLRLRALDRRRAHNRPPVREIAGLRLDPFRREVYRDGRYVALTRKQFAVLEVLVGAEGGVVSAEELLERAWDENADPFTNAVRITVSALRKRLGEPWLIATVAGVGYRIDTGPDAGREQETWIGPRSERPPQAHPQLRRFLMLAGVLLLAAVWVFCCDTSPTSVVYGLPSASPQPVRPPARLRSGRRPSCSRSCWCSVSWEGGFSPAGCSPR